MPPDPVSRPSTPARRSVLYLGWQREPVESLRRLGAQVTCVVTPELGRTAREQDFEGPLAIARDHTDTEDVLGAVAELGLAPADFWTVCTEDEFAVVAAAVLGSLGSAHPAPVPVALALRDKAYQKQRARAAGVAVADWVRCPDLEAVRSSPIEPPFVVKPPAGAGSQQTWIVTDPGDLDAVESHAGPGSGPWLVERFVPGEELHVDGVVRDGRVLLASVSRYLNNVIEVHQGRLVASATMDDTDDGPVARTAELTEQVLAALAYTDGVFHLEAFHDDGRLTFGECAGRIGGGLIQEAVLAKYGVDLYAEWAAAALDLPSPAAVRGIRTMKDSFGWANIPTRPGRIRRLPSLDEMRARPGVVEAQLWAKAGETVGDMSLGSHLLVAKALVRAPSEAVAREQLSHVAAWFEGAAEVDPPEDGHE
ncbi:ATP-grasp domain-containing protein [Streptomyces sp. NPDC048664]|uniref:ATP-grasp domain-containing protein n=1 Tax=Streptomyces sp. NPDC048664 TaxID=3154505 RepID=UPI0034151FE9